MMPLQIIICAILCLSSALTIAVDVQELDNQILVTGEVTLPDCKLKEYTRWDKLMTMLENSHMRQNMLLQEFEEVKVALQTVKEDLWQMNTTGSCSDCLKSITTDFSSLLDSKCHPDNTVNKNAEKSIALNLDIADRLEGIENLLKKREDAEQDKPECPDILKNSALVDKLDLLYGDFQNMQDWIHQRRLPSAFVCSLLFPGCDTAILFPMRSPKIYASVHPADMSLRAFTFCVWTKVTEALEKTIVISYGTKRNPYEIQLYFNRDSPVLVVGGDENKITANNTLVLGEWSHVCGTWKSEDGETTLWVNGEKRMVTYEVAQGHLIPGRGILQLGQEKNGCCVGGGFDESLSFSGKITAFNLWDAVLSDKAILNTTGESGCKMRGNVVGWGTTEIQPHGGAQYID
ncbi:PREDICTED: pentraxin-related protein PTX3 [Nanorana parkeri]|uniref:pentraxin-related protein PTX3 n=1 Tax=Nanorana parkeri TaxID=125878 RepID=UPI000854F57B|nr:PREDICTED: pentraxin-related protein PTX3 [Nanorana parkeri]